MAEQAFDADIDLNGAIAQARKEATRAFDTGATRDTDSGKLDYEGFISPLVTRAFAEYMHRCRTRNIPAGQALRASDNWQKGIPQDVYAKSLIRHVQEFWLIHDGFEAFDEKGQSLSLEDVCCAIKFNIEGFLFEELKKRPGYQQHIDVTDSNGASRLPGTSHASASPLAVSPGFMSGDTDATKADPAANTAARPSTSTQASAST